MAPKATKTQKKFNQNKGGARLSKSLRKHIRLLKSEGRTEEAESMRNAALENRKKDE